MPIATAVTLALSGVTALAAINDSVDKLERVNNTNEAPTSTQDVTLWVADQRGNHLGSAVSLGVTGTGFWAITNRHVVAEKTIICLKHNNLKSYPVSVVLPPTDSMKGKPLDVAFLWAPAKSMTGVSSADWQNKSPVNALTLPIVEATGYPAPSEENGNRPEYLSLEGLLIPLFSSELEEGFDTAYTAPVQKGMSGGGVFLNSRLVAINGVHSDPLWPGQWRTKAGAPVSKELNQKLGLVSLGISTAVISKALEKTPPPNGHAQQALQASTCDMKKEKKGISPVKP